MRAFGILGMHRSGTTYLMRSLHQNSVQVGNVSIEFYELRKVWELHDRIIERNGIDAFGVSKPVTWTNKDRRDRDAIIKTHFQDIPLWGIKDPRLMWVLDGWLEVVDLELVGTFRHPLAVAASLARRNKLTKRQSIRAWCAHNERLLQLQPKALISYDDEPGQMKKFLEFLGLPYNGEVYNASLRHHVFDHVPEEVVDLYSRLKERAFKSR